MWKILIKSLLKQTVKFIFARKNKKKKNHKSKDTRRQYSYRDLNRKIIWGHFVLQHKAEPPLLALVGDKSIVFAGCLYQNKECLFVGTNIIAQKSRLGLLSRMYPISFKNRYAYTKNIVTKSLYVYGEGANCFYERIHKRYWDDNIDSASGLNIKFSQKKEKRNSYLETNFDHAIYIDISNKRCIDLLNRKIFCGFFQSVRTTYIFYGYFDDKYSSRKLFWENINRVVPYLNRLIRNKYSIGFDIRYVEKADKKRFIEDYFRIVRRAAALWKTAVKSDCIIRLRLTSLFMDCDRTCFLIALREILSLRRRYFVEYVVTPKSNGVLTDYDRSIISHCRCAIMLDLCLFDDIVFKHEVYEFDDQRLIEDLEEKMIPFIKNCERYMLFPQNLLCDLSYEFIYDKERQKRLLVEQIPISFIRKISMYINFIFSYRGVTRNSAKLLNYPNNNDDFSYGYLFPFDQIIKDLFFLLGCKKNIIFDKRNFFLEGYKESGDYYTDIINLLKMFNLFFCEKECIYIMSPLSKIQDIKKIDYSAVKNIEMLQDGYTNSRLNRNFCIHYINESGGIFIVHKENNQIIRTKKMNDSYTDKMKLIELTLCFSKWRDERIKDMFITFDRSLRRSRFFVEISLVRGKEDMINLGDVFVLQGSFYNNLLFLTRTLTISENNTSIIGSVM